MALRRIDSNNVTYANFWQSRLGIRIRNISFEDLPEGACTEILSRQRIYQETDIKDISLLVLLVGILFIGGGVYTQFSNHLGASGFYWFGSFVCIGACLGLAYNWSLKREIYADIENGYIKLRNLYQRAVAQLPQISPNAISEPLYLD